MIAADHSDASVPGSTSRLVVYTIAERRGRIDAYVPHALAALRPHASRVIVVAPDGISDDEPVLRAAGADDVIAVAPTGFPLAGYRAGLAHAAETIDAFDEVLLVGDEWYGPVRPFAPLFERMAAEGVDYWSMTDHETASAASDDDDSRHPTLHLHWFAARRAAVASAAWRRFWREGERAQLDSAEGLAPRLEAAGLRGHAAFPSERYPTHDASVLNADLLIEDGCPILRRAPLSEWPPYLDSQAVIGRWVLDAATAAGYPAELILEHQARTVPPRVLNADAALHTVLSEAPPAADEIPECRIAVVAHVYYEDLLEEILGYAENLPGGYDLFVTTSDPEKAERIRRRLDSSPASPAAVTVRVVGSNAGRDQSAFLVEMSDVLRDETYDLVVKLHTKKSPQDGFNNGEHFRTQQLTNLLGSTGFVANMVALFAREPRLGIVFPSMIHIGAATLGRGWATNRARFETVAAELGIGVPLDDVSPLAPYGSMFIARPAALRLLVGRDWRYQDFEGEYGDGSLAHVLERMPAYAAAELGYYARTLSTREYASISHTALDYKLDQISATTPGYPHEQISLLRKAGFFGEGYFADVALMYLRVHRPGWVKVAEPIFTPWTTLGRLKKKKSRSRSR